MPAYQFDSANYLDQLVPLLQELDAIEQPTAKDVKNLLKKYRKPTGGYFAKDELVQAYRQLAGTHGLRSLQAHLLHLLQMKPTRTMSGVTPVTVLTKPFPCPGKCIFCPNDIRMPKSYLSDEPGAQRAERNWFDPYLQTYNRLQAFANIGHSVDKVELIILGGTWSFYPEPYQIWFIKECFRALNDFGAGRDGRPVVSEHYQQMQASLEAKGEFAPSDDPTKNRAATAKQQLKGDELLESYNQVVSELYVAPERRGGFEQYQSAEWSALEAEQRENELAKVRNVGLVIETRPDNVSETEVKRIRRLGCTKTQIGVQSLQDAVLTANHRGHDVAATRRAFQLLRQAGFKIHAHWMANLHGSSVTADQADYDLLFSDPDFKPDELKIYPCSLIESAELMAYYQRGEWRPYTHQELLTVLKHCLLATPGYCRLTRVIRDIPSPDIVVGNKLTNFRQLVENELEQAGQRSQDIRSREIKSQAFDPDAAQLSEIVYETSVSQEHFLQYQVNGKLAAFLRLSLPTKPSLIDELTDAAIIRELHVYGQAVELGAQRQGKAQHQGLGKKLLAAAQATAAKAGFAKLAVISAIGTREYYRQRGFQDGELYQSCIIAPHEK